MAQTTSDSTAASAASPGLVTVSHPEHGTDQVPLDAALALEAQNTGWTRDTTAQIAQLEAEKALLEQEIAELKATATAEAKTTRKTKADEATTKSEED